MRYPLASLLLVLSGFSNLALGQTESNGQAGQPAQPANSPLTTPAATPSGPPPPNTLQNGTAIKLRLAETLSSANAKTGQQVSFETVEETDVDGVMVIAKGAQALATITTAEPKKSMGRGGKLDVNIDSVRLVDGEKAALAATQNAKGGGHTGAMTAGMVGTAIVFFPAAPLLLFIHGKDITIPKGTEVTAFVSGDMRLNMTQFAPTNSTGVAIASAAPPGLTIEASVPNCDIEVDGNFVGSTPSTLSLTPGKHDIVVKKTGYQVWSRSMMVGSGSVRLSADMVAK
jgi:PEGA domain